MCHAKRFGSATVAAVCVMATMAMPAVALGEGREIERPGSRDAAAVEREASEFAAGWSWLDELGEVMRMLWDASRGIIVPGDDATGGSSSTALEPANEEGLSGEV